MTVTDPPTVRGARRGTPQIDPARSLYSANSTYVPRERDACSVATGQRDQLGQVTRPSPTATVTVDDLEPDALPPGPRADRPLVHLVVDAAALALAVVLAWRVLAWGAPGAVNTRGSAALPTSAFLVLPIFLAAFSVYGLYSRRGRRIGPSSLSELKEVFHASLVAGVVSVTVEYLVHRNTGLVVPTATMVGLASVFCLPAVLVCRSVTVVVTDRMRLTTPSRVILVGSGRVAQTVSGHLRAHRGVELLGLVDDEPADGEPLLGSIAELPELCERLKATRVVVCFSRVHPQRVSDMIKRVSSDVRVSIVPRYFELASSRSQVEDLYGIPMVDVAPRSPWALAQPAKRAFDLVAASVLLVLLAVPFAVIAVWIKATSPGPVFFKQERTGRHGVPFLLFKFRTMYDGAEKERQQLVHLNEVDGPLFKVRADPRVTRVGRFLRRTSIDELPQLINVWRGEMSLVGPRPFITSEAEAMSGWVRQRLEVRPGMSGLWQVSGRNELSYIEMCRLDCLYVASWSFWWDMKILCQTPAAMLRGRGAS